MRHIALTCRIAAVLGGDPGLAQEVALRTDRRREREARSFAQLLRPAEAFHHPFSEEGCA